MTDRARVSSLPDETLVEDLPLRQHTINALRARMPRDKRDPAARKPPPYEGAGSAAINATVARVAPAVLGLLGDGVPRSRPAIVEALAGRHARDDVVHTLIRLAVTGQVVETGGKYTLAASEP